MRALVLTGGGARGADQIGRVVALYEKGYRWDFVVGTSVGAVNALGLGFNGVFETDDMWNRIKSKSQIMRFNWSWPWNFDGVYSFAPLRKWLDKETKGVCKLPVFACYVDNQTLKVHYADATKLTRDEFLDKVIASCVVSGIQSPQAGQYVDGGHREFAPVEFALSQGATEIDVVSTVPYVQELPPQKPPKGWFPILWHFSKGIEALTHEVWIRDVAEWKARGLKINIFAPSNPLDFDMLAYNPEVLKPAKVKAYLETHKQLKNL